MKKKVYILLVQIATIAILLSLITVGLIFYKAFEKQVFLDLETMAHLYASVEQRELNHLDEDVFLANHVRMFYMTIMHLLEIWKIMRIEKKFRKHFCQEVEKQ